MGSFLQTSRPPDVLAADEAAVAQFERLRDENAAPEDILNDMKTLREEHDGRATRALRAIEMLRERYHWKARPNFAAEEQAELEKHAATAKYTDQMRDVSPDNEDGEEEVEEQVLVDRGQSEPMHEYDPSTEPINVDDDDSDRPLDPDDDLFEEVA